MMRDELNTIPLSGPSRDQLASRLEDLKQRVNQLEHYRERTMNLHANHVIHHQFAKEARVEITLLWACFHAFLFMLCMILVLTSDPWLPSLLALSQLFFGVRAVLRARKLNQEIKSFVQDVFGNKNDGSPDNGGLG